MTVKRQEAYENFVAVARDPFRRMFVVALPLMVLFSFLYVRFPVWVEEYQDSKVSKTMRQAAAKLEASSFNDYYVYYGVHPKNELVAVGSPAEFWSDSEIKKIGYSMVWDEHLVCDKTPFDDINYFGYYRDVQTSRMFVSKKRARPVPPGQAYEAVSAVSDNVITYNSVMDCMLKSHACQLHEFGVKKCIHLVSTAVKIRELPF